MILKNVSNKPYNNIPQHKLLYYWDDSDKKHFFSKEYRNEFTAKFAVRTELAKQKSVELMSDTINVLANFFGNAVLHGFYTGRCSA